MKAWSEVIQSEGDIKNDTPKITSWKDVVASQPHPEEPVALTSLASVPPEMYETWRKQGKIGWVEASRRARIGRYVPFFGMVPKMFNNFEVKNAAERLRIGTYAPGQEKIRNQDVMKLHKYLLDAEEMRTRGLTTGAKIFEGVSILPAYMAEMAATSGIFGAVKAGTQTAIAKGVEAGVSAGVKAAAGKAVTAATAGKLTASQIGANFEKMAGTMVGTGARLPAFAHKGAEKAGSLELNGQFELTDTGRKIADQATMKPFTAWTKAMGDTYIETLSEVSGETLTAVGKAALAPVAAKISPIVTAAAGKIPKEFMSAMTRLFQKLHPNESVKKLMTKVGWSNFLGEVGEERLGDIYRAMTGVDDFGADNPDSPLDRLAHSIPNGEEMLIEMGVLAVPMGGGAALNAYFNEQNSKKKPLRDITDFEIDRIASQDTKEYIDKNPEVKSQVNIIKEQIIQQVIDSAKASEQLSQMDEQELLDYAESFADMQSVMTVSEAKKRGITPEEMWAELKTKIVAGEDVAPADADKLTQSLSSKAQSTLSSTENVQEQDGIDESEAQEELNQGPKEPVSVRRKVDYFGLMHFYGSNDVAVVGGMRTPGMSRIGNIAKLRYAMYDTSVEGGKEIGVVDLAFNYDTEQVESIVDIKIHKAERGKGYGSKIVEMLRAANPESKLKVNDIKKSAEKFWTKSGASFTQKKGKPNPKTGFKYQQTIAEYPPYKVKIQPPVDDSAKLPDGASEPVKIVFDELKKANKERKLTPNEIFAQEYVLNNYDKAREDFIRIGTEEFKGFSRAVSADIGKFAIPGFSVDKSADYHEAGSSLSKAITQEFLADPTTMNMRVGFTAGGSGSGKTHFLRMLASESGMDLNEIYALVHDTNLNDYNSGKKKIDAALATGRGVSITYVYREPLDAWKAVLDRAMRTKRVVPMVEHLRTTKGALPTVESLYKEYKGKDVKIAAVENIRDNPHKTLDLDNVPTYVYTSIDGLNGDQLYEITKEALNEGKIDSQTFWATLLNSPEYQRRAKEEGITRPDDRIQRDERTGNEGGGVRSKTVELNQAALAKGTPQYDAMQRHLEQQVTATVAEQERTTGNQLTPEQIDDIRKQVYATPGGMALTGTTLEEQELYQAAQDWNEDSRAKIRSANEKLKLVSPEKLESWMQNVTNLARYIIENKPELLFTPSEYSSLKDNADYGKSLDFSTLCKKRALLQATIETISVRLWQQEKRTLTAEELLDISNSLRAHDQVTSCGICYVDSARAKALQHLGEFAEKYPQHAEKFFTMSGWDFLKKEEPTIYEELRVRFGGLGGKGFESRTDYRGEILGMSAASVSGFNERAGMRWQSWSDFELPHAIDAIHAAIDHAVKGLAAHAYTKVVEFVELMAPTGMMINQSLIAKGDGFNPDGTLAFDDIEGMPAADAFRMADLWDNVGTILVGISDKHIRAALDDSRIHYVIPYHASGLSEFLRKTKLGVNWKDYTKTQRETVIDKKKNDAYAEKYSKKAAKSVKFDEHKGDVEKYKAACAERGLQPKFVQFIDHPNYYKLITDFRIYGRDGKRVVQKPLKADFDMNVVERLLKGYKAPNVNAYEPTVDEFFSKDLVLHQTKVQNPRGKIRITPTGNQITIMRGSDPTTIVHEFSHAWLDNIYKYVQSGKASKEYLKEWEVMAKWLGVKPGQTMLQTPQHEQFAKAFEAYKFTGAAPTPGLVPMFRKFERWFKGVYNSIQDIGVTLDPNVTRYFDSMFSIDAELDMVARMPAVRKQGMAAKSGVEWLDKTMVPITTRLSKIDESLRDAMRMFEYGVGVHTQARLKTAKKFLDKYAKLSVEDARKLDYALKNVFTDVAEEIIDRNGMRAEYDAVRAMLDMFFDEARDVGIDVKYIEDYWPRKVADHDAFIEYVRGTAEWSQIRQAIEEEERANSQRMTEEERVEFINKFIRGLGKGTTKLKGVGATKSRTVDHIDPLLNQYYKDSSTALIEYIHGMTNAIEARRFFGKSEVRSTKSGKIQQDYDDTIGWYVNNLVENGTITAKQEREVKEILKARFEAVGPGVFWSSYKNLMYIYTMGTPISAVTQLGDLAFALYSNGFFNTVGGLMAKNKFTKQDLGIDLIAQEFADRSKLGDMVTKIFKIIGLEGMDNIGKEAIINGALLKFQKQARSNNQALMEMVSRVFGAEAPGVMDDLRAGRATYNVKYLLFAELARWQPITISEMPATYANGGNARVFYALKSYTIKQIDAFHNEVFRTMQTNPKKAMQNLVMLAFFLMLMNGTADLIKDVLLGRKIKLTDIMIDNILRLTGFSKWQIYQTRREGLISTIFQSILPPAPFIDDIIKDAGSLVSGTKDVNELRAWQRIPIVGKFYYWWFGGGKDKE